MDPFCPVVIVPCVTATVMPLSNCGAPSVTCPEPETIFGDKVTVPFAGTMVVSGFRSHSAAGTLAVVPVMTSSVAVYGAKLIDADHAIGDEATMVFGADCDKV